MKRRYRTYRDYLEGLFGARVQKVMLDAGFTCPNRDGTKGKGGCLFCDQGGSGAELISRRLTMAEQLEEGIQKAKKADKFIAYFQAFTNTYASVETLRSLYLEALKHPQVVGISIGTRPDCINSEILDLLCELKQEKEVWVEYGLQSAFDETLQRMNRGHGALTFVQAVRETQTRGIPVSVHQILGLPFETPPMMMETARLIASLKPHGIKIHFLYLEEGMPLLEQYRQGVFPLLEKETYIQLVCDILEILPSEMVIERLAADPWPDRLVAPQWALQKASLLQHIDQELEKRDSYQGKYCI